MAKKAHKYTVEGTSDLLLNNPQTIDPTNDFTKRMKAITGKRVKVDADHYALMRLEWEAKLYFDKNGDIALPGLQFGACMLSAAKKQRKGDQVKSGLFIDGNFPLEYEGRQENPCKDPDNPTYFLAQLWEDPQFHLTVAARVGKAMIMRTRPRFDKGWRCTFALEYNDEILNLGDITKFLQYGGEMIGVGDWRPRYGRFTVIGSEPIKAVNATK